MLYNLNNYFDFDKLNDIDYIESKHLKKYVYYEDTDTYILKYDKQYISHDNVNTLGLFRSLIFHNDTLVGFSPPKSSYIEKNDDLYKALEYKNIEVLHEKVNTIEELVEGTMINVYYYNFNWHIATRSKIGAKVYYFHNNNTSELSTTQQKTFRTMFLECMNHIHLEFSHLNKDYCYSFVMQHPENRIVLPIKEMALYLTNVYHIYGTEYKVQTIDMNEIKQSFNLLKNIHIKYPKAYTVTDLLCNSIYYIQGYSFYCDGNRYKIRNKNYEYVRKLRGNQPKKQFHYLTLRKTKNIKEYLKYYPEDSIVFELYREQLHAFSWFLYETYVNCFIKKQFHFNTIEKYIQPYVYQLHSTYLHSLLPNGNKINFNEVKQFVNSLDPKQQMFLINYPNHKTKKQHIIE